MPGWEREQSDAVHGRFTDIARESWQPLTWESGVVVPGAQAGLLAGAVGLAVLTAGGAVAFLCDWPVEAPAAAAVLIASVIFAREVYRAVRFSRESMLLAREQYTNQQAAQAAASNERITLEWIEHTEDGGVKRAVYDELGVPREKLGALVNAPRLSKRGLMDAGFNDAQAMRLLAQLLTLGYITREADNAPGEWTARGRALCKAFAGGGGGGGA
jgi:hypothetical protein